MKVILRLLCSEGFLRTIELQGSLMDPQQRRMNEMLAVLRPNSQGSSRPKLLIPVGFRYSKSKPLPGSGR